MSAATALAASPSPIEYFHFGPLTHGTAEQAAFWQQHTPVVKAWAEAKLRAGQPWYAACHAASCLVSYRVREAKRRGEAPGWAAFDVHDFLFAYLAEGGTVGSFGPAEDHFTDLVDALEQFIRADLIPAAEGCRWLATLCAAKQRFCDFYEAALDDDGSAQLHHLTLDLASMFGHSPPVSLRAPKARRDARKRARDSRRRNRRR